MKTKLILVRNSFVAALFISLCFNAGAQNIHDSKINIDNFQVVKEQNKITITWSTNNSSVTNYFEVEKSIDGKNFKTVAYVLGADPGKPDCECFGCFDKINGREEVSYYRLKHVNINGIVQFSEMKMLALK